MSDPHTSELPVLRRVVRSSTIDLVAEEIRNLAERSAKATADIADEGP